MERKIEDYYRFVRKHESFHEMGRPSSRRLSALPTATDEAWGLCAASCAKLRFVGPVWFVRASS
jgi:hypothetical protein